MCGKMKGFKIKNNGYGMLKIYKMIKVSILMQIRIYNHFQVIMDLIFGN